jgi:hypothetical protein
MKGVFEVERSHNVMGIINDDATEISRVVWDEGYDFGTEFDEVWDDATTTSEPPLEDNLAHRAVRLLLAMAAFFKAVGSDHCYLCDFKRILSVPDEHLDHCRIHGRVG